MIEETSTLGSICAVIVTYNVASAFDTCFNSVKGQVDHVVIVNTSTDDGATAKMLKQLKKTNNSLVEIVESPENNLGLAQNLGIAAALRGGFDWVLLLDHDSRLGAGMLTAMERELEAAPRKDQIGIIAPYLHDPEVDSTPRYLKVLGHWWFEQVGFDEQTPAIDDVLCVSASGSLIPARIFREDGIRMDEDFVIDGIDTDFCLRLAKLRYRILAVRDARLEHKVGHRKQHKILGFTLTATHHSALRRYYLYRNRIRIWKRHAVWAPGFFLFDALRVVYEIWRILLVESDKNAKISMILTGIWDGIFNVRGAKPGTDMTRTPADKLA